MAGKFRMVHMATCLEFEKVSTRYCLLKDIEASGPAGAHSPNETDPTADPPSYLRRLLRLLLQLRESHCLPTLKSSHTLPLRLPIPQDELLRLYPLFCALCPNLLRVPSTMPTRSLEDGNRVKTDLTKSLEEGDLISWPDECARCAS